MKIKIFFFILMSVYIFGLPLVIGSKENSRGINNSINNESGQIILDSEINYKTNPESYIEYITVPSTSSFLSYGFGGIFCLPAGFIPYAYVLLNRPSGCKIIISATGSVAAAGDAIHNPDGYIISGSFTRRGRKDSTVYSIGQCVPGAEAATYLPVSSGYFGQLIGLFLNGGKAVGSPFVVGEYKVLTIPVGATGLLFAVNDDGYCDNYGSFSVTVNFGEVDPFLEPLGAVFEVDGKARINNFTLTQGTPIYIGDKISSEDFGSISINLSDEAQIKLEKDFEVSFSTLPSSNCEQQIKIDIKKAYNFIIKTIRSLKKNNRRKFEIHSPGCGVGRRGTIFNVVTDSTNGTTKFIVFEDTLDVYSFTGDTITIWAFGDGNCQQVVIDSSGLISGPEWIIRDSSEYTFWPYKEVPKDTVPPKLTVLHSRSLSNSVVSFKGNIDDNFACLYSITVEAIPGIFKNIVQPIFIEGPDKAGNFSFEVTIIDEQSPASIVLVIKDRSNNTIWEEVYVSLENLNHKPTAYIESPFLGSVGVPISFNGSGSTDQDGDSLKFSWNFGDGEFSTSITPQHTYTDSGIYNVILTVDDYWGGIDYDTATVQIYLPENNEILSDNYTVLLEHFNNTTLANNIYTPLHLNFVNSLPSLGEAVVFNKNYTIRYDLTSWYIGNTNATGSIEALIYLTSNNSNDIIVLQWYKADIPPDWGGYIGRLRINEFGKLYWWTWGSGVPQEELIGKTDIPLNIWTHIAVTWGENGTKLYVNGLLDTTSIYNICPQMESNVYIYLGDIVGYLDELHISKITRSDEYILSHYNQISKTKELIPINCYLDQNYPNPFNLFTTIRYYLPDRRKIKLSIFNILGNHIKTMINEEVGPGYHITYWKGSNNEGFYVPSGIYLYRIEAGSFTETKKLILIR